MSATPSSANFGSVQQHTSSAWQQFVITNTGLVNITMATPVTTFSNLDYSLPVGAGDTCSSGLLLLPAHTCTKTVVGNPSIVGADNGSVTFSATNTSVSVALSMTGTAAPAPSIVITPRPVAFPTTLVGQPASTTETATVTNNGNVAVVLVSPSYFTLTGLYAADFTVTGGTCIANYQINVGSSCTIILSATPSSATLEQITIVVNGTASASATVQIQGLPVGPPPANAPAVIL
jgi:hypothetical protein